MDTSATNAPQAADTSAIFHSASRSLSPSSAQLVAQLIESIKAIESATPDKLEDWTVFHARQQGESVLRTLERLIIPASTRLRYIISSPIEAQALYIAQQLGIAQALVDARPNGLDVATLASRTHAVVGPLERLMRVLELLDIARLSGDRWTAGGAAQALIPGHEGSVSAAMDMYGNELYTITGFLGLEIAPDHKWPARQPYPVNPAAAKNGTPAALACQAALGVPYGYEFFHARPDRLAVFTQAMVDISSGSDDSLVADYPWERHAGQRVCDIGGADGHFMQYLLAKHPAIIGATIVDKADIPRPADAPETLEYVRGDFFKSVPTGHQAYFMRHIVHNWSDADVTRILINIRKAMVASSSSGDKNSRSVLLIAEPIVKPDKVEREVTQYDLTMLMALPGARERTVDEFHALCEVAGLRLAQVWPTRAFQAILEVHVNLDAKMEP